MPLCAEVSLAAFLVFLLIVQDQGTCDTFWEDFPNHGPPCHLQSTLGHSRGFSQSHDLALNSLPPVLQP